MSFSAGTQPVGELSLSTSVTGREREAALMIARQTNEAQQLDDARPLQQYLLIMLLLIYVVPIPKYAVHQAK